MTPTVRALQPTINLGSPIHVNYEFTDHIDGRFMTTHKDGNAGTGKFVTQTGADWIGLFKKGECANSVNTQDKNKCYVHWEYVPPGAKTGTIVFEAKHYKVRHSRCPLFSRWPSPDWSALAGCG